MNKEAGVSTTGLHHGSTKWKFDANKIAQKNDKLALKNLPSQLKFWQKMREEKEVEMRMGGNTERRPKSERKKEKIFYPCGGKTTTDFFGLKKAKEKKLCLMSLNLKTSKSKNFALKRMWETFQWQMKVSARTSNKWIFSLVQIEMSADVSFFCDEAWKLPKKFQAVDSGSSLSQTQTFGNI